MVYQIEKGRKLFGSVLLPDLNMGTSLATFKIYGKNPYLSDKLRILESGCDMICYTSFSHL